jgi:NADPH2:quinone reductase
MNEDISHKGMMKAVFSEAPGSPLIIKETEIPQPGPGEVLIKIAAAPVNPSDIAGIKYTWHRNAEASFIPGLEGSGRVVAAGGGLLAGLWMGKRVACSAKHGSGGTWAEYMVTSAGLCFPLGKKVSDEQGSMSLVNPLTAIVFFDIVKKGRHKAIINNAAASALGRMVELLGRKNGIPVINLVRSRKNAEKLRSSGSEFVLDSSEPSFIDDLQKLCKELRATLFFDSTCSRQLMKIIEVLPYRSSVVIYGNLTGEKEIYLNPRSLIDNDIKISGFYLGAITRENSMLKNTLNLMKVGRLMSSDLKINIQARFPLSRAQQAIDTYLSDMSAGKVLIVPE